MSSIHIADTIDGAVFGHAWRDDRGTGCATVRLGWSSLSFDDPDHAEELAAACVKAANAIRELPPVGGAS